NDVHIRIWSIPQDFNDRIALRISNEHAARPAVNLTELLTRKRNRWRVNHRRHFIDVLENKSIEEDLVVVLQSAQINVALQIVLLSPVRVIRTQDLLLQRFDVWRKQP